MVREGDHCYGSGVTLSSIDLLQERFRQLQKMKELRQEKELLRLMLSESSEIRYSPPSIIHNNNNYVSSSIQNQMMMFVPSTPKPHCQLSLSLWPDHHDDSNITINKQRQDLRSDINSRTWFISNDASIKLENNSAASHIDTSLRL